jgi:two-component system, chemotaxis family, protein-glutamate methylesterase/glutaminase
VSGTPGQPLGGIPGQPLVGTGAPSPALIVIGGSWGGMEAAATVLSGISRPIPVPVLVVLHRSARSDSEVVRRVLGGGGGHEVREVEEKERLRPDTVHLAPPDYHVLVEEGGVSLSVEGPVNNSRPSIDLAFDTAAAEFTDRLAAVLLTGSGRDGAAGIAAVKRRGGRTFVQSPEDAVRPDMPLAALATGLVDESAPAEGLGRTLQALLTEAAL